VPINKGYSDWTPVIEATPRQLQIILARADGLSIPETAERLGVGVKTVKNHITALNGCHQEPDSQIAMRRFISWTEHLGLDSSPISQIGLKSIVDKITANPTVV
jgi:hypothetical protein